MDAGPEEAEALWEQGLRENFPRYLKGEISFQEQRRGRIRAMFSNPALTDAEAVALRKPQKEIFELAARMGAVWMDRFGAAVRPPGVRRVTGLGEVKALLLD